MKYGILFLLLFILSGCGRDETDIPQQTATDSNVVLPANPDFFYCIATTEGFDAIYRVHIEKNSAVMLWRKVGEHAVKLVQTPGIPSFWFLSAFHYGKSGMFPFIQDVKLYRKNTSDTSPQLLASFGDGLQLSAAENIDKQLKILINTLDARTTMYIDQHAFLFDTAGNRLQMTKRSYDLKTDGYPSIMIPQSDYAQLPFKLSIRNENVLEIQKDSSTLLSLPGVAFVDDAKENRAGTHAVIITRGSKADISRSLYLLDIAKMKVIFRDEGAGVKNFLLLNDFLIFDNGFGLKSRTHICSLTDLTMKTVPLTGGCGIEYIPVQPE